MSVMTKKRKKIASTFYCICLNFKSDSIFYYPFHRSIKVKNATWLIWKYNIIINSIFILFTFTFAFAFTFAFTLTFTFT